MGNKGEKDREMKVQFKGNAGECRDHKGDMRGNSNAESQGNTRTYRGQDAEGAMSAD